ncbi:hypothetical protein [Aristophania vespae]|uniref:hypothetical protein n=1 Tax=Aristophania vespae TaxID=2697033 RepID=UPI002351A256|nr:hypothetical protein [Aristophania vespae]
MTHIITATDTVQQLYPSRYYAAYDTKAVQPTAVTGWYDSWGLSSIEHIPPASDMIALTEAQWNDQASFRLPYGRGVQNGKIINYTSPPLPVPLKDQAQSVLSSIQSQAPMIVAMGQIFGSQTQAYVKALTDIINGADTVSTELPIKPDRLTK